MKLGRIFSLSEAGSGQSGLDGELRGPRWVMRVTAIAVACFLIWAYIFEIDQVARAPGVVLPSSKIQIIQSKDGGVLLSLPVEAGDKVVKGQVIARLIVQMRWPITKRPKQGCRPGCQYGSSRSRDLWERAYFPPKQATLNSLKAKYLFFKSEKPRNRNT